MMRVELSRQAREDIFELADYASDYSDTAVYRIADEVDKSLTLLGEFPESGRARPEFGEGSRALVNRALDVLILYLIRDDHVFITRVVNSKSDYLPHEASGTRSD